MSWQNLQVSNNFQLNIVFSWNDLNVKWAVNELGVKAMERVRETLRIGISWENVRQCRVIHYSIATWVYMSPCLLK